MVLADSANSKLKMGALLAVLGAGIFVRFYGFAHHFGHIDDLGVAKTILACKFQGQSPFFAVPLEWTYGPFQLFFTSILVNLKQSYREILFWGRLPSCLAGAAALVGLVYFYRSYDKKNIFKLLVALSLVAFSWENIICARQMHNYAIGVMAVILLIWRYIKHIKDEDVSVKSMAVSAVLLAVLTTMQYSVLFFVPSFFLGIFVCGLLMKRSVWAMLRNCVAGGVLYGVLVFPVWLIFIRKYVGSGAGKHIIEWAKGANGEFYFALPAGGFTDQLQYVAQFFIKNSFFIFQNNLAFFPLGSGLAQGITWVLLGVFFLGIVNYATTSERNVRFLGVFGSGLLLTWIWLVVSNNLTLSPTRHNIILLPYLAMTIAEGFVFLFTKFFKESHFIGYARAGVVIAFAGVFCFFYPQFYRDHYDRFDEAKIYNQVKDNKVDLLIAANWTLQPRLMKSLRDYYNFYDTSFTTHQFMYDKTNKDLSHRVAWISSSEKLTPEVFEGFRLGYNVARQKAGLPGQSALPYSASRYRVVHQEEIDSTTYFENGDWIREFPNGYYFYILERI